MVGMAVAVTHTAWDKVTKNPGVILHTACVIEVSTLDGNVHITRKNKAPR